MKKFIIGIIIFCAILSSILLIIHETKSKDKPPPKNESITIETTINALKKANAKLYGAKNCPLTIAQLEIFNNQLTSHNNQGIYIQCSIEVHSTNVDPLCKTYFGKHTNNNGTISLSYPTWNINGQQHQGVQELHTLYSLASATPSSGQYLASYYQAISKKNSTSNTSIRR
jgi:hypothetical protein